jgi:hypothetical protein
MPNLRTFLAVPLTFPTGPALQAQEAPTTPASAAQGDKAARPPALVRSADDQHAHRVVAAGNR